MDISRPTVHLSYNYAQQVFYVRKHRQELMD